MKVKIIKVLFLGFLCFISALGIADAQTAPPVLWILSEGDSRPLLLIDNHGENKIVSRSRREENNSKKLTINIRYPQIVGNSLDKGAEQFNKQVNALISQQLNEFRKNISPELAKSFSSNARNSFKMDYELASFVSQSQQTKYISIRFNIDANVLGMAHPYRSTQVLNFDVGHNHLLTLSSIFKPNTNYLNILSNYSIKRLQTKLSDKSLITEGARPSMDNYKNWNFTLSGLLISFGEDQVAPRYFGFQQILIPYNIISPFVNHQTACTVGIIRCDKT